MKLWTTLISVCGIVLFGYAQEPLQTLRVDVELVQVYASVTDALGRYVKDLKRDAFQIFEDGIEQKIEAFSADDVPISVGIVFDVSGTMKPNLAIAREGALTFLKAGHLSNEYFLVEFNNKAEVTENFTRSLQALRSHTTFLPATRDKAVWDGMYIALDKLRRSANPRKALLVMTTGGTLTGLHKSVEVRELARKLDVQIFGVELPLETNTSGEIGSVERPASEILESVGGIHYIAASGADYLNICLRISIAMRNQYAIAYRSSNSAHDGKFRRVRVKLNPPKGTPELFVTTREGYFAPEP